MQKGVALSHYLGDDHAALCSSASASSRAQMRAVAKALTGASLRGGRVGASGQAEEDVRRRRICH